MPIIRPSSDLRNSYNEISTICHQTNKPIYITKNGAGDLAVMSIELYESLTEKCELEIKEESKVKPKKEEIKTIEKNYISKKDETANAEFKLASEESVNAKIDNKYANKENKMIENSHQNRENKDTKNNNYISKENIETNHSNANGEKNHLTETVFKKMETNMKTVVKTEPESAHEILQEIEIEPIVKKDTRGEETSKKESFRNLDTELKNIEKKETHVAKPITGNQGTNGKHTNVKDIKNTDWIFEDLNKMLNDIKV